MQNKGGVEEKGLESKAGFCPTELGVSSFQVGLWESSSESSLKVSACESPDHVSE